jgi:anti-sigma regulatory factor (Ser/Thr protein kinase)
VEAVSTLSIPVEGPDQAGVARRAATEVAKALGFDEVEVGRVAIVATECASNLWKHGSGGEMLIGEGECDGRSCIELVALDRGPGMRDVARCFEDGYSTAGSPGSGLGAVGRLSDCDVYTRPGKGTALFARIVPRDRTGRTAIAGRFASGAVSVPLRGETVCGDGYALRQNGTALLAMMADGLGHGPMAAEGAACAIESFRRSNETSPEKLIREIHRALRVTRGGAVSVVRLDAARREIRFVGVGNVLGLVTGPGFAKNFVAMPGIVGHNVAAVREFTYDWPANAIVLIYSDGIGSHWSLDEYEGLTGCDPSLISAIVYRDRKRGRDDASVLTIRERISP